MKRTLRAALLVFALLMAAPAWAGDEEDCLNEALLKAAPARAVSVCSRPAEQGNALAQFNLGFMYENGQGMPQDYAEAVKWYRKAADQGDAAAQNNLSLMYAEGQGVAQDYVQANMWSNLAAARFPASMTELRDKAVKNRDRIVTNMTPAQIAEAQKLAREWKPK